MTDHYDALDTREPAKRETELFARLPDVLRKAMDAPAYGERMKRIDPDTAKRYRQRSGQ